MLSHVRNTVSVQKAFRDSGGLSLGHSACGLVVGPWLGIRTQTRTVEGSLHAVLTAQGIPILAFFSPTDEPLVLPAEWVGSAEVKGRGMAKAIQMTVIDDEGDVMTLSFRGPIKRMTAMLMACGLPVT
jgi:hypothetical protein